MYTFVYIISSSLRIMKNECNENKNKKKNRKSEVVNIRISKSQRNQINEVMEKLNLNQSEVIRLAIENVCNQHIENNK